MIGMKIPVVFAFDDNYALPASVAIRSLFESRRPGTEYEVVVLHSGLGSETMRKMESIAPIRWVRVDDSVFRGWPARWNRPTCYRLVMADVLGDFGKVIWSDCDVLFTEDLSELYETELNGWDWAAVPMESPREMDGIHRHWNDSDPVFAAGCIVADLEHWRREGFSAKFAASAAKYDCELEMLDLDVLNSIGAKVRPLPPKYCVLIRIVTEGVSAPESGWFGRMHGMEALHDAVAHPAIIHYAGPPMKVWLQRHCDMTPLYRDAVVRSPFWDVDRERGGWRAKLKMLKYLLAYALTGNVRFRRMAGVYRRGA